ncbi:MAG: hypothetical protein NXI24_04175 [bacterium]|nr:hypothetical protein [bacterium]
MQADTKQRGPNQERATTQRRALVFAILSASLGPVIVAATGALLRSNVSGMADLYFGFFKNTGFLLPVIIGLLLSAIGALPGIIILSETFKSRRRVAAALSIVWAVICLTLCLGFSDFA